ncbi:uncharacterized protein LOC126899396 isoform X40 [Daktulosphaira vitifoliae]|uniref:uncharacterized protein LOC126899396 isoform X38 n=1 Tax=Daktulosphaira vitifoliae TaxID=58002 RepID=UPI0021AADDA9|nr:uncharacterized protein LOC126899396 isoform X38 [Daktulosphaira vitifoliae]XP_050530284.1 uncharacterized protein LOC126899396 isoform X40 [Daktulosphaira vitifoliae]
MTSLKIVLKCFLLFYIILRIESENNKIENTRIVNNLFKCIGWKNLKRVKNVTYLWKNYDLPSIIQQPITPIDCNKKIRIATVFLGCIYISIIMDIMSAVNYQRIFCDEIMSNEFNKTQGYNCTLKLLEIMTNFTLFTKKIQGALYAIDSLHRYPWKLSDKSYIILNFISEDFQNLQSQLDKWSPSRDDLGYNKSILCTILFEMENIKMKILCNTRQFCTLESDNIFVLTNNLNILYKNIDLNGENIAVYYSGSEIILNGIEMFILENFTKLGFKFDLYNGETFIPNSLLHLFTEANNESKSSPATNPVVHDFLQKEAVNESETSPATNPACYDFLQKEEAVNKSETSLAMNPAYYDFLQKETNNDSNTPPGTAPTYDFLQKEAVNELETSQATNPVFYDFLQKDLIGDTIMNEETDIEKGELTKKYPQHFIKFL